MKWPDIHTFPHSHPGPYEKVMGERIAALLRLFQDHVPDPESHTHVLDLAITPSRWSAGHALFDHVRGLLLTAMDAKDHAKSAQYHFEEACLESLYNSTNPPDPFDPGAAFWVAGASFHLGLTVLLASR